MRFQNPILSGFHPDPSLCWAGDDCYLVTSSFEYGPGLPIFQSRDLVHWRQVGHALTRPEQLPVSDATPSGGIFAPTIRHHQGTFYIITTNITHGGNLVVTAQDPAGPWSDPFLIADAPGIDPSLFFDDDGRCWYTGNGDPVRSLYEGHHTLWLQEFDPREMRLIGEKRVIVDGGTDITKKPIWIEGPHLYKRDGRYYLLAAEGGTAEDHSVVVFRSDLITGPYASFPVNPILTNRHLDPDRPMPINWTGHGDLFQTPRGEWWMVLLACRPYPPVAEGCFSTGRETFLVPMDWEAGWPVTRDGTGHLLSSYPVPDLPTHPWEDDYGSGDFTLRDDFAGPRLRAEWNFLRTPEHPWASLTERPGSLRLAVRPERLTGPGTPSFVGLRQRHAAFSASTEIEFQPATEEEGAGLVAVQNNTAFYLLEVGLRGGGRVLRLLKQSTPQEGPEVRREVPVSDGRLRLKIEGQGKDYAFFYAGADGPWQTLCDGEDGKILSTRHAGGFVGAYLGLYATSQGKASSSHADFDGFEYSGSSQERL